MYFSGLRRAIQDIEEKKFYDVALLFLQGEGYKGLSIIDGTGDGGRDVSCSRTDLRIQLSVRKDWENKINDEAAATRSAGKRHLIYITNRLIRDVELAAFKSGKYKQKGEVDLSVYDLNRIATSLSAPGMMKAAYEKLGYLVQGKVTASPKEIAISNLLLFSNEAKDLRQDIIESNLRAYIYKNPSNAADAVIGAVSSQLPGIDREHDTKTSLSRLLSKGEVISNNNIISLSSAVNDTMAAAEEEYLQAISHDISSISKKYDISREESRQVIEVALEIAAREGPLNGDGQHEILLADFISNHNLARKKEQLYEDLSKLSIARVKRYGKTLDHIFSTNTFDIYRSLGRTTNVGMLLDSSVAMPLMFGLCFGSVKSRYSIGAAALHQMCHDHGIKIVIPRCYVNEMIFHGKEAIAYAGTYKALNDENRVVLKSSSNSYLSHYSHLRDKDELPESYTLSDFLAHFGLTANTATRKIENALENILDDFGVEIISAGRWEPDIRQEISDGKPSSPTILIDHDASVCTFLKNSTDEGYIFATWDKVMIGIVEGRSRIFADTPANVADFLSMASGSEVEATQSFSLLGSLLYCDEKKAAALAEKIEKIESAEKAFEYQRLAVEARSKTKQDGADHESTANDHVYKG
jgi:hypothetical protein